MSGKVGCSARTKSVEWYTPSWVFERLAINFDMDPASPHDMDTAVPAIIKYTLFDDGLNQPWQGKVWLNPPYGKTTPIWMSKMVENNNGIALVFSRTDAKWFQNALVAASAVLFVSGRIQFVPGIENIAKKSRCGAGSAFFAFGDECANALSKLSDRGFFISHRNIVSEGN
jgi:hypothetical protein